MKSELKPCPFCGGKAEYKRTAIKTNGCWTDAVCVRCTVCDSRTGRILYDAKKHPNCEEYEEAAEAWNRRSVNPVPVGYKMSSTTGRDRMMCSKCLKDITEDAVFCKYCGAKMEGELK